MVVVEVGEHEKGKVGKAEGKRGTVTGGFHAILPGYEFTTETYPCSRHEYNPISQKQTRQAMSVLGRSQPGCQSVGETGEGATKRVDRGVTLALGTWARTRAYGTCRTVEVSGYRSQSFSAKRIGFPCSLHPLRRCAVLAGHTKIRHMHWAGWGSQWLVEPTLMTSKSLSF